MKSISLKYHYIFCQKGKGSEVGGGKSCGWVNWKVKGEGENGTGNELIKMVYTHSLILSLSLSLPLSLPLSLA